MEKEWKRWNNIALCCLCMLCVIKIDYLINVGCSNTQNDSTALSPAVERNKCLL